jgi:hypothetical protein
MNLKQNRLFIKSNYINFFFYILPFVSFYFSLYQLNQQYDGHHHGIVFSISEDFLNGKIPYRDFFPHYGISYIIINSLFIKIFFGSIYGTYFFISLSKGIALLIFGLITKKIFDQKIAISAMLMMFFLHPFVGTPWPDYLFFIFILISFYILIISNNNFFLLLSGFFYSIGSLTKDNFTIILFFAIIIFFIYLFFLEYVKKKKIQKNLINIYWIVGYLTPLITFFLYLIYNSILFEYLDHLDISKFAIQYFCTSEINIFSLRMFDCGIIALKVLFINSISRILTEPYWLFFLLIIILNIFFIISVFFFDKKKIINKNELIILWISFLSLILFSNNFYGLAVQRLFTGVSLGLIVLIYLIQNFKSPVNRYFLHCVLIAFLINGLQFARTPNNPIYPTYVKKIYNSSNNLKFLRFKKLSIDEWYQLIEFESLTNKVTNNCAFINYSTNLTNDVFYRIILKQKFKLLNFIPFGPRNRFISQMFEKYDNNFYSNLKLQINKNNILIAVDQISEINLELKNNSNLYLVKSIKYSGYGTRFINIYLPKNCTFT